MLSPTYRERPLTRSQHIIKSPSQLFYCTQINSQPCPPQKLITLPRYNRGPTRTSHDINDRGSPRCGNRIPHRKHRNHTADHTAHNCATPSRRPLRSDTVDFSVRISPWKAVKCRCQIANRWYHRRPTPNSKQSTQPSTAPRCELYTEYARVHTAAAAPPCTMTSRGEAHHR